MAAADPAQYFLAKLRLPEAHALAKGERVLVAVLDTPIDAAHPDLAGVVEASFDATGAADKPHPHGTGIASVIAAHGKLTGAAPGVRILAAHAFKAAASSGTSLDILKGLDWAGKSKANIVNMSFAGPADAELQAMLKALRANGVVLIAAVGNAGPRSPPLYPAADPNVIAVSATDMDDKPFAQANRGTHIAVAAPGVSILAAAPDGGYQMPSGTSFSAAQISGIAALLLERNPKLDAASIRRILMGTARDLGPPGHDDQFGSGLADALAAVNAAAPKASDASAARPGELTAFEPGSGPERLTISEHTRSSVGASAPFHLRVDPAGPLGRSPSGRAVHFWPQDLPLPISTEAPLDAPCGMWL